MEGIRRILVVDDEPEVVCSLLRHLWREGFETDFAHDGLRARSKLIEAASRGAPFDLVILDVVMPGMSGIDLFKWIKEHQPQTSALFMLAFGDHDSIVTNIRCEMDGFEQKPLTPGKVMQNIECIHRRRTAGTVGLSSE